MTQYLIVETELGTGFYRLKNDYSKFESWQDLMESTDYLNYAEEVQLPVTLEKGSVIDFVML